MKGSCLPLSAAHNPFRVEAIHALGYRQSAAAWETLMARLADASHPGHRRWQGAILGAHGSGKTTLLLALADRLEARGERVHRLFLNDRRYQPLPASWRAALAESAQQPHLAWILADGYDHLHPLARWQLRRRASRLITTTHRRGLLPILHHCRARPEVLAELIQTLDGTPRAGADVAALLARHRGNMRDALRACFDQAAGR